MRTIQERMAEIKAAQEAGTYTRCPRCGENTMKLGDRLATNALSRSYDIMICDLCGTDEAKMAFMGAPKPLAHWSCLQPQHQKDFKALPAEQAIQKLEADAQLEYLMELYRLWLQYPVNTDWEAWRLDAYEHCPGLTTLWYEPFEARYDVADGALVIRFRVKGNAPQYAIDILKK